MWFFVRRQSIQQQFVLSLSLVAAVVLLGLALHGVVGYRVVAFMLLFTVSILALFLDILPVIVAALLSALLWDFLFIPPRFTFTVGSTEDRLLLLTYFVVVLIHAVLTYKIRQVEKVVRKKEEKAREVKFYNALFNSLSHELRTPITTIIAATDNLLTESDKLSHENQKDLLREVTIASTRLNRQVENLLSMSRLESGTLKLKLDWCDVRELVYTTLKQFDAAQHTHRISVFVPDNLPLFKLDFGLMEQVLYNLIGNALQHTPAGTDVIIKADCVDDKLLLSVSDNGSGFPHAEIGKVFDKFYRVSGSRVGGTGLGLSIARGFVEAHHGTISLRNLPLSGAEFSVEIPTDITYLNRLRNE